MRTGNGIPSRPSMACQWLRTVDLGSVTGSHQKLRDPFNRLIGSCFLLRSGRTITFQPSRPKSYLVVTSRRSCSHHPARRSVRDPPSAKRSVEENKIIEGPWVVPRQHLRPTNLRSFARSLRRSSIRRRGGRAERVRGRVVAVRLASPRLSSPQSTRPEGYQLRPRDSARPAR